MKEHGLGSGRQRIAGDPQDDGGPGMESGVDSGRDPGRRPPGRGGGPGPACRPRGGGHPPRHQAREHHGRPRWGAGGPRLRPRPRRDEESPTLTRTRRPLRDAGLHVPGAADAAPDRPRPSDRRLVPRRLPLRVPDAAAGPFEAPTREGLYQQILSKDPPDIRRSTRESRRTSRRSSRRPSRRTGTGDTRRRWTSPRTCAGFGSMSRSWRGRCRGGRSSCGGRSGILAWRRQAGRRSRSWWWGWWWRSFSSPRSRTSGTAPTRTRPRPTTSGTGRTRIGRGHPAEARGSAHGRCRGGGHARGPGRERALAGQTGAGSRPRGMAPSRGADPRPSAGIPSRSSSRCAPRPRRFRERRQAQEEGRPCVGSGGASGARSGGGRRGPKENEEEKGARDEAGGGGEGAGGSRDE